MRNIHLNEMHGHFLKVAKDAIGHIFGSNGEKEALVAIFDSWKMKRNDLL